MGKKTPITRPSWASFDSRGKLTDTARRQMLDRYKDVVGTTRFTRPESKTTKSNFVKNTEKVFREGPSPNRLQLIRLANMRRLRPSR